MQWSEEVDVGSGHREREESLLNCITENEQIEDDVRNEVKLIKVEVWKSVKQKAKSLKM